MSSDRVTVVGGGIFGLTLAWEFLRRGSPVRVLEAARIGSGSSGGTVGALAPHDDRVPVAASKEGDEARVGLQQRERVQPEVDVLSGRDGPLARGLLLYRRRLRYGDRIAAQAGAPRCAQGGAPGHLHAGTGAGWQPAAPFKNGV